MPASSASATVRSWSAGAPRTMSPPTAPQPKPRIEVLRPVRPNARVSIRAPQQPWGASTRGLVYSIGSGMQPRSAHTMPITLGMFDASYAHIGERLRALGLDIAVRTFSKDGTFLVDGRQVPPSDVVLDYAWLSNHINADGFRDRAFDLLLNCKSIGVLQTFNAGLDHPFYKALSG